MMMRMLNDDNNDDDNDDDDDNDNDNNDGDDGDVDDATSMMQIFRRTIRPFKFSRWMFI